MSGISNRAAGGAVVQQLLACGVDRFFLSPGARSAPIVDALAESAPGRITTHFDERGMAFCALGHALATGRPAACLTTSGSAVANLLPAAVEAYHSEVPLLLLTADRPARLRGSGSNQTIRQPGLFGGFVRAEFDIATGGGIPLGTLRRVVADAVQAARKRPAGPVHINLQFDEPLLVEGGSAPGVSDAEPVGEASRVESPPVLAELSEGFFEARRGVIVLGQTAAGESADAQLACELGGRIGWPVLADGLGVWSGSNGVIRHADLLLSAAAISAPDAVLHLGGRLVSKRLQSWLATVRTGYYVRAGSSPSTLDPHRVGPTEKAIAPDAFCRLAIDRVVQREAGEWLAAWRGADEQLSAFLASEIDSGDALTEPLVARICAAFAAARGQPIFLGNSMPVRDFCAFREAGGFPCGAFANRGASGIDGSIATAAGISMALGLPCLALLGDLAALHDLNSLPLFQATGGKLVIINNGGGGIFQFLPMGMSEEVRERFLETPHSLDFSAFAAGFGIDFRVPGNGRELADALGRTGGAVIEVRTGRRRNFEFHRRLALRAGQIEGLWPESS